MGKSEKLAVMIEWCENQSENVDLFATIYLLCSNFAFFKQYIKIR